MMRLYLFFFFFNQKTAYDWRISDWSSDVCSSDLQQHMAVMPERMKASRVIKRFQCNGTRADLAQPRLACVAYEGQEHGASRDEMATIAWHAESVPIPPGKNDRETRR